MSGFIGFVLGIIFMVSKKANENAVKIFFGVGLLAIFYACFAQWRQEYHKAATATAELRDRVNNIHIDDPAYQNLAALVAAFERLKQSGKGGCPVFMTNPKGSNSSVFETVVLAAGMAVCETGFNSGLGSDPESIEIGLRGYDDERVVIHAARDDKYANQIEDDFRQLFLVTQSRELLKDLPPRAIWIQVGRNVQ
jgi:hypothetical protein